MWGVSFATIIPPLVNAVQIQVMNAFYGTVAIKLTDLVRTHNRMYVPYVHEGVGTSFKVGESFTRKVLAALRTGIYTSIVDQLWFPRWQLLNAKTTIYM